MDNLARRHRDPVEPNGRMGRKTLIALIFTVLVGFSLRLGYLAVVVRNPGFEWSDPDGYAAAAHMLSQDGTTWRWTFDAVLFSLPGRDYYLPPLYPAFLSLFTYFPHFAVTALLFQLALATLSILALFDLGRTLHSTRAGLIAAFLYALWLPNIVAVWSTTQEALHVPLLLLAFALLARAMVRNAGCAAFFSVGLAFGAAALARSMPFYFIVPACGLYLILSRFRRTAWRQVLGCMAGVMLLTIPYSAALSLHLGEPAIIDNYGGMHIVRGMDHDPSTRPGALEAATLIWRAFRRSPGAYVLHKLTTLRSILHLNGGRLLQLYLYAGGRAQALLWKICAHVGVDFFLLLTLTLAPLGAILARRRSVAALFALWIAASIALPTLGDHGGARMRVTCEPHLIALAAVVLSGRWRSVSGSACAAGLALAAIPLLMLLPQIPRSLSARGDYGVRWLSPHIPKTSAVLGRAGFNTVPVQGRIVFKARNPDGLGNPILLRARFNGNSTEAVRLDDGGWRRLRYDCDARSIVFVDIFATEETTGAPGRILITRLH